MYYNIVRKTARCPEEKTTKMKYNFNDLLRYVVAMCLMIAGFAFAFMVVSFGLEGDVFKHPLKSGMTTLTMVLGEFNFGELYQAFGREL